MKIVYCIQSLYITGGVERVVSIKANYFVEKLGYEVHFILTDGNEDLPYFPLNPAIKIHHLNLDYIKVYDYSPVRRVYEILRRFCLHKKRLRECLNQIKPDITILTNRREVRFILPSLDDGSIKIAEAHIDKGTYLSVPKSWDKYMPDCLKQRYQKGTVDNLRTGLARFIVLTHEDAEAWTELKNVTVIPNPITNSSDGVSSCENKRVIAVGRYEPQKGFDMLLDAWKLVAEKHKDWTLHIYGDGFLREKLEKQSVSLGIEDLCFLEQKTIEIGECYKNSSLFVLSSRYEGFALVLLEAMSYGLPVVSFACPCGPKDLISNGEDGFLVEPNNVEELARKISYLIENDEVRKRMGQQASVNVQRFDIDRVMAMWKQLFEELLKEKRGR